MASLKIKFRASILDSKEGILYYQIIHKRVIRQVSTSYKLFVNEWDMKSDKVIIDNQNDNRFNYLELIQNKIESDRRRFAIIIQRLTIQNGVFTVDDIVERFRNQTINSSLFEFIERLVMSYKKYGQYRTSETYQSTLNSLKKFRKGIDVDIIDLNEELIIAYEYFLKTEGVQHNTISFYMHRLRAIYNKAVDKELIEQKFPFKHLKISIEKTIKRAIPVKYIRKLKSLDLNDSPSKAFARDMFLFSFYTRGMSFVDIAYLQKKDLQHNMLAYRRKKTGQKLQIHWETCMQQILNKYPAKKESQYLFSIIENTQKDHRRQYQNALIRINRNLKKIGETIGLDVPLTMYVARHSWATTARSEGVPISVISEGMGHDNEKTTQVYLASIDNKVIDNANRKIIKLI